MTRPDRDQARERDRVMGETGGLTVRAAVFRMVEAVDPDAFTTQSRYPGDPWPERTPAPLPALRAAVLLARIARTDALRHVRRAREAGISWADLAPAVDAEDGPAAFDWAAGPHGDATGPWADRYVLWRCPACDQLVRDYGPDAGHPDETETGHAPGCPRHTAALTAWRRDLDAWDYNQEEQDDQGDESPDGAW